ncbi:collectin-11-like [Drosophila persimilis]|uniref:collectin-11-like n=1 Tax=Drosophila persimilis TaxID=7234 RepID=UPI000F090C61|nr:collectin-11-like [Drosophila persimilis]
MSQHCEVDESQHECGGYCYGAVKPVLEYLAILQMRVESYEAKQPADTLSKIAQMDKKLETLGRELAIQQELEKSSQSADTLKQLAKIDEKLEAGLGRQLMIQQELEKSSKQLADTLLKIAQNDEKLEVLGRQFAIELELEKSSQMRLQRLELFEKIRKDETKALGRMLNKTQRYWIDVNDIKKEGEFISATTGLPGTFFHWQENEPNNKESSENCVELITAEFWMNDQSCHYENYFICETPWDSL